MESEEYSAAEETVSYMCMDLAGVGKGKMDKKRRFSEDQIKSLETMFETQTKLEPRKKLQLARELGLQPRQVAIWFQNKRARWKSKQLEREYSALRADYDALVSNFETLKKDKQILLKQLQKLNELMEKPRYESSNDGDSENGDSKGKDDVKPGLLLRKASDVRFLVYPDDKDEKKLSFLDQEDDDGLRIGDPVVVGSLASAEQQCCLDCTGFAGHCCNSSQWWEFWPVTE